METTFEALKQLNAGYDAEHGFDESDYETALEVKAFIEKISEEKLIKAGDVVVYTTKGGRYYRSARVDNKQSWHDGDDLYVCEVPYIPFVSIDKENNELMLSMSGGAFTFIDRKEFKHIGKTEALFHVWGHCGACGNGAIKVPAEVNLWEVDLRKGEYSEQNYEFIMVSDNRDSLGIPRDGSRYGFIGNGIAWTDEDDLNRWLAMFNAVEDSDSPYNERNRGYWIYKRTIKYLFDKAEFDSIDGENCNGLFNGRSRPHKIVKDHDKKTVTIYVDRSDEERYGGI